MFQEYSEQIANQIKEYMIKSEIKATPENGTFKVVASDETVDRAGEVIKIDSRDLENYMKSPIILF
jgi:Holliday junction resolvase RusA-like endonuclease